jgi:hypothetical protein
MALPLLALTACGTTNRFVDQPHLTVVDEPQKDARQAMGELFGSMPTPFTVKLCEADPSSKECTKEAKGISATGVGGIFLPLHLYVKGIDVKRQQQSVDQLAFDASLHVTVDAISPLCGTVGGKIVFRENNTANVLLRNFYCNWMVIGNVIVNADLSIDSINLKDKVVTGFYKLTFHGTGNAAGSGYYKAVLAPKNT